MNNVLTVDVEDWYHANGYRIPREDWAFCRQRVEENTHRLLNILRQHQVLATFFILGDVAQQHPDLVRSIAAAGHEIGSHGGYHRMLPEMSLAEFRRDLRSSKEILEKLSGCPVRYFRAPSWSMTAEQYGALGILWEEGFVCDSSIQPFHTPLSGIAGAPHTPFFPVIEGRAVPLLEFPPSVVRCKGVTIPFAGGFYLRAMPYRLIALGLKRVNRTHPGMVYVHPWELDDDQPDVASTWMIRQIHTYNRRTVAEKIHRLLDEFSFAPLGKVLAEREWPQRVL